MMPSDNTSSSERSQEKDDDSMGYAKIPAVESNDDESNMRSKVSVVKAKKRKKRKPKDMPKRPLSAYNIFFREERARILESWEGESTATSNLFSALGKKVAQRWKELDDDEKKKYNVLAAAETERYSKDMEGYHLSLAQQNKKEDSDLEAQQDSTLIDVSLESNNDSSRSLLNSSQYASLYNSLVSEQKPQATSTAQTSIADLLSMNHNSRQSALLSNLDQLQLGYHFGPRESDINPYSTMSSSNIPQNLLAQLRLQQLVEHERLLQIQLHRQQALQREAQHATRINAMLQSMQRPDQGRRQNATIAATDFWSPNSSSRMDYPVIMPNSADTNTAASNMGLMLPFSQQMSLTGRSRSDVEEHRMLQLLQMQLQDARRQNDVNGESIDRKS